MLIQLLVLIHGISCHSFLIDVLLFVSVNTMYCVCARRKVVICNSFLSQPIFTNSSPIPQICYILYPGDESLEGKTLRLKQQYTLCSASLQDIIARFEKRSGEQVNWDEFPQKVAVQMNDTHPTLCIPELLRILIDVKDLSWKNAWEITQRYTITFKHVVPMDTGT